jgi:hypothetical protein
LAANPAGLTKTSQKTSYINCSKALNILNVTAHEVGHLLGLADNNRRLLNDGKATPNPAYLPGPGAGENSLLMYFKEQEHYNPTMLFKPEWDIINPTNPQ